MIVKLMTEHILELLCLKCDCRDSSESTLVKLLEISAHLFLPTVLAVVAALWTPVRPTSTRPTTNVILIFKCSLCTAVQACFLYTQKINFLSSQK